MMMMESSREGYEAKQEGETIDIEKLSKASSTSRHWSGFRNPRIVRVSRSFGGKDRHSKVCTIRGLRDRRIRLSVPTAIQLYDLQDKLGVSQPSKVIDWLLEATKFDIDKLPPLQFPQGFSQFHQQTLLPFHQSSASELSLGPFYEANSTFLRDGGIQNLMARSRFWDMDSLSRIKEKEAERGYISEKGKWIKTNDEQENEDGVAGGVMGGYNNLQVSTQKLFPMGSHSSLPGLPNNAMSEPANMFLSQFGSHGLFHSQVDPPHPNSGNGVQFQTSLPVPLQSGSQLLFGPSSATPSLFTPFMTTTSSSVENDPRQFNHFQFLNSGSSQLLPHHPSLHSFNSPVRPFPPPPLFSSKLLDSENNNNRSQQPDKGSSSSARS